MSRPISDAEVAALTGREPGSPYTPTADDRNMFDASNIDWDSASSWYWPGSDQIRPQTRAYRIIGRNGKPTGRIVYAKDEVQAAALRQNQADAKGTSYIPSAELIDVVFDDEQ